MFIHTTLSHEHLNYAISKLYESVAYPEISGGAESAGCLETEVPQRGPGL